MVFSSLIFLFGFLPLTLVLYFSVPRGWRNAVLFAVSLLFYAWGEPVYLILMLLSLTAAYLFGIPIAANRQANPTRARRWMILSVVCSLAFLFFFKYYNFFAVNLSRIPYVTLPVVEGLRLPIGISFYTFQILSYTVDVWRGESAAQRNYVAFGTYVTLFPQLIAGPIVRYGEIDRALTERQETVEDFAHGVNRFVCGLAKKILLGDLLAAGYAYCFGVTERAPTVLGAWLAVILYSLHLYFDFSGYTDMAIGLGRMFGFRFPENFNYPYVSRSITEFWRRWHMSLSSWFRAYVYIPLGGNRRGLLRCCCNLAVVWLLTGFWHGANWNFLLWGGYFAVILILEKLFFLRLLKRLPPFLGHLYALFLILVGFLIFSTPDLSVAWHFFGTMLGIGAEGLWDEVMLYQLLRLLPLLMLSLIGATPLPYRFYCRLLQKYQRLQTPILLSTVAVFLLCVCYLVDSTFSPFEYTQF